MKISIVTISFNQCRYLKQCMDSVLDQRTMLSEKGVELEYIVVDPGSTDGSRELIESYCQAVVKVFEKDAGPSNGLNNGFSKATGDIGCFLNSDDVFLPGCLSYVAEEFKNNSDLDVLMGDGYFIDEVGNKIKRVYATEFSARNYVYGAISFIQQSVFFKLDSFHNVGGFNEQNFTCWDGELFLDMAVAGCKFKVVRQSLGLFRLHDEGITGSGRLTEKYLLDSRRIFEKVVGRRVNSFDVFIRFYLKGRRLLRNPVLFNKFLSGDL
jgi:glycosyltransferase involved in cell wall biosynthesis